MTTETSPYSGLPITAYWKTAVSQSTPLEPGQMYTPKFPITKSMRIATAGSCFAQHVGRTLKKGGFSVIDMEPFVPGFSDKLAHSYGYRLYSARYGNIYTVRQLWQLIQECFGKLTLSDSIWEREGRYFDAFRPSVEPEGLPSPEAVKTHRNQHLAAVRSVFQNCELLVFTFGLTEAWTGKDDTVYPTAPGTIAGTFDPSRYRFVNFSHAQVLADFKKVRNFLKDINPDMRFLITVSPVPLTATASGQHVEVATCYSKSTLRSVCGELTATYEDVDYFPSYEIITSQKARGAYYEANLRNVSQKGVETAMSHFMQAHGASAETHSAKARTSGAAQKSEADVVCEEALLEAFSR